MELALTVVACNGRPPDRALSVRVTGVSCVLGRHPYCQLELPDPECQISGRHALINRQGNGFSVTDISTNGTFLNDTERPLDPSQPVDLHDGDRLTIGQYVIEVAFVQADDIPMPEAHETKLNAPSSVLPDSSPAPDILDLIGPKPETPFPPPQTDREMDQPQDLSEQAPRSSDRSKPDPLLTGKRGPRTSTLEQGQSASPSSAGLANPLTQAEDEPPSQSALRRSSVPSEDEATLQVVFDEGDTPLEAGASAANEVVREPSNPSDHRQPSPAAFRLSAEDSAGNHPGSKPPVEDESGGTSDGEPDPSPPTGEGVVERFSREPQGNAVEPAPKKERAADDPRPSHVAAADEATPDQAQGPAAPPKPASPPHRAQLEAFLSGLGTGNPAEIRDPEQVMRTSGELLRAMTHGLMAVMMARASFKSELRLGVTTVRSSENNPFQFCVDLEDALERLLWRPSRGFLDPAAAARKAFDDIQTHQMALMAGLQGVLQALLTRIEPHAIEQEAGGRAGLRRLRANTRKAKCWDLFVAAFDEIADDASEDFMQLFGDAFNRSYDEQIERLSEVKRQS